MILQVNEKWAKRRKRSTSLDGSQLDRKNNSLLKTNNTGNDMAKWRLQTFRNLTPSFDFSECRKGRNSKVDSIDSFGEEIWLETLLSIQATSQSMPINANQCQCFGAYVLGERSRRFLEVIQTLGQLFLECAENKLHLLRI